MFKKVTKIALAGVIGVGMMVGSSSLVSAGPEGDNYQSKAKVKFKYNDEITPPVDPTDPTKPVDKDKDEDANPGTKGPLSIDYISNFNFGILDTTASKETYYAKSVRVTPQDGNPVDDGKQVAPYAQVTDNRGNNQGWNLSVKQDGQLSTTNPSLEDAVFLKNAQIKIGTGKTVGTLTEDILTFTEEIDLDIDGASSEIFGQVNETIGGTFVNSFSKNNLANPDPKDISVTLTVQAGTAVEIDKEYTTNLNWILADTPFGE